MVNMLTKLVARLLLSCCYGILGCWGGRSDSPGGSLGVKSSFITV